MSDPVREGGADLRALLRDTVRESLRSWRLPAALALGVGFGLTEQRATGHLASVAFGPLAAMYTLLLGPLPWRALVPLEADGHRARKLVRWFAAAGIALTLFLLLVAPYAAFTHALAPGATRSVAEPRELTVATLLFLVGGWGLARDVQLEQRLDRSLRSHGELTAELQEARLYALRADLDPHFLFNALNTIANQCALDPGAAEENVVRLSSLLRAVLDTRRRALHTLDEELALARDYLGLLAARYPALRVRIDTDAVAGDTLVPPLILQPLLENAVRHGTLTAGEIAVAVGPGTDGALELRVRSPGPFGGAREGGMGLELVRRRAELAWGAGARFTIETVGADTVARVCAPASAITREARAARVHA